MANRGRLGFRASRPRILRLRDPFTFKTLQTGASEPLLGQKISKSKNEFIQNGRPRVTSRAKVRRLFVRDPYNALTGVAGFGSGATVARFSPVADQFTDNPNIMFDPSKAPKNVREVSAFAAKTAAGKPGKASRGHAKVIRRTIFNQNAGKRLRRR